MTTFINLLFSGAALITATSVFAAQGEVTVNGRSDDNSTTHLTISGDAAGALYEDLDVVAEPQPTIQGMSVYSKAGENVRCTRMNRFPFGRPRDPSKVKTTYTCRLQFDSSGAAVKVSR